MLASQGGTNMAKAMLASPRDANMAKAIDSIPGGYSTLSWVRMCGPKFRPPPYNKTKKTQICYLYQNHSFLEGPFLKPISAFYNVNWDA